MSEESNLEYCLQEWTESCSLLNNQNNAKNLDNVASICSHFSTEINKGAVTCMECGIELGNEYALGEEYRAYYDSKSTRRADPRRCHNRTVRKEKSIMKELSALQLPNCVAEEANFLYKKCTENKLLRGNARKALVFACVFNAFKFQGDPRCPEEIQVKFDLTRKEISRGLSVFNICIGKYKEPAYITVEHIIPRIMALLSSSESHIEQVQELWATKLQNKSDQLSRSNPRSVVAALVFYYCRYIGKSISCQKYSELVELSAITIYRLARIISEVLGTLNNVNLN